MEENVLYKCGNRGVTLRCLDLEEAELVLKELYAAICGSHYGSRALSHRAMSHGYHWYVSKICMNESLACRRTSYGD